MKIYYHCLWHQLSTTFHNAAEVAQWELLFAVNPSQVRTIASENLDQIDWPLPPTLYMTVPPERHLHTTNERHKFVFDWPLRVLEYINQWYEKVQLNKMTFEICAHEDLFEVVDRQGLPSQSPDGP